MRRPPDRRRGPSGGATPRQGPSVSSDTDSASVQRDRLLELSDERDLQLALRHADYHRGRLDGARDEYSRGYSDAVGDMKSAQHDLVDEVGVELGRWHLCCRSCRLGGHRDGCARCEDRTRATFANPHPDDYQAGDA